MQTASPTHFRDLNATGQNITNGVASINKLVVVNTSAATAFVQLFDMPAASVTLGTTRPMLVLVVPASSGFVDINFDLPGWMVENRLSAFSTTTAEGNVGSAAGVFLQAFIN